jgi:hypothetical protein
VIGEEERNEEKQNRPGQQKKKNQTARGIFEKPTKKESKQAC